MLEVRIKHDPDLGEDEIIICAGEGNALADALFAYARALVSQASSIQMYRDKEEVFLPPASVLFFETGNDSVHAHTADEVYRVKARLYELEQTLPGEFVRISKSAIVNVRHIVSVDRNLSSSALISFQGSHKQVYASRMYYKQLRQRLGSG
ncbi:MAG: LytTR family transcriptional regulator [Oscillospiraceae bacterium]|jgi:DNA-binding LytR/AlgR family response regulator|nr:LytTR family transcriptional regulator [Oscillospiraceae bacterium]